MVFGIFLRVGPPSVQVLYQYGVTTPLLQARVLLTATSVPPWRRDGPGMVFPEALEGRDAYANMGLGVWNRACFMQVLCLMAV